MKGYTIGGICSLLVAPAAVAASASFAGEWKAEWCDKKRPHLECGQFVVSLVQRGRRVCGTHYVATIGLSQIDEGSQELMHGLVVGNTLSLQVTSGRSGDRYSATAVRSGKAIDWRIGELVRKNADGYGEGLIIPPRARLRRMGPTGLPVEQQCEREFKNGQ